MLIKSTHNCIRLIQNQSIFRLVYQLNLLRNFKLTSTSQCSTPRLPNFEDTVPSISKFRTAHQDDQNAPADFESHQTVEEMGRRKRKPNNSNVNHPKKMQKYQQDQSYEHIEQYVENGMRKIKPYVFTFETHAKGRWLGKKLMDVFKKEFRMETSLYYKTAIEGGLIRLNGKTVKPDRVLRNQDFLQSRVHRHEPPVSGEPLNIIAQTDDFIVINKPSSIPIHPAGKYRHNSLVYLMAKEHRLRGLHTFYRLDRLTSGVFIFARSLEVVKKIDNQVRGRELHKVYLCKVNGEFPSEPVECSEPIFTVSHKIGVCRVSPEGKPSKTQFQRVSYDGETSIVKCVPHTGRMHQIRVHLQYLGFPILNDPLYTGTVWGPDQGKDGKIPFDNDDEFIKELTRIHNKEQMENQIKLDCQSLVSKLGTDIQDRHQDSMVNTQSIHCTSRKGVEPADDAKATAESTRGNSDGLQMTTDPTHVAQATTESMLGTCDGAQRTKIDPTNDAEATTAQGETISVSSENSETIVGSNSRNTESSTDVECALSDVIAESKQRTYSENASSSSNQTGQISSDVSEISNICEIAQCKANTTDSSNVPEITDKCESAQGEDPVADGSLATQQSNPPQCNTTDATSVKDNFEGNASTSTDGKGDSSTCSGSTTEASEDETLNRLAMELCRECQYPLPDPEPESMVMYLHALTYKGPDFEFSTPLPRWASEHMSRTESALP